MREKFSAPPFVVDHFLFVCLLRKVCQAKMNFEQSYSVLPGSLSYSILLIGAQFICFLTARASRSKTTLLGSSGLM